jgi:CheY-like chemotaxis protein
LHIDDFEKENFERIKFRLSCKEHIMVKPKSIFLIDDDEDERWLFAEALARTVPGVICTSASNGQDALDYLSNSQRAIPDLVLMDLHMPGMDGKMCLAEIKKIQRIKNIPVIVYSTSNYPKDRDETLKLGATDFIIKPRDYNSLCSLLLSIF